MAFFPPFRRYQAKDQDVNRIQDFVSLITQRLIDYPPTSEVSVSTGAGHGSVATKIRRFSVVQRSEGSSIAYIDSATAGGQFLIRDPGVYSISYTDTHTGAAVLIGLSKNSTQLTTSIASITAVDRLLSVAAADGERPCVAICTRLESGDIVRAHTNGVPTSTSALVQLTITQLSRF